MLACTEYANMLVDWCLTTVVLKHPTLETSVATPMAGHVSSFSLNSKHLDVRLKYSVTQMGVRRHSYNRMIS